MSEFNETDEADLNVDEWCVPCRRYSNGERTYVRRT